MTTKKNSSDVATYEYVRAVFSCADPDEYDRETADLLEKTGKVFSYYREKSRDQNFIPPDEIQLMIRKMTAVICTLSPRLAFYESEEMRTYWKKNLIRAHSRKQLFLKKTEKKLTDKLIETMSDTEKKFEDAVNEHILRADLANRIKLFLNSAKIMLESLRSEIINLQVERKYLPHSK